MPGRNGTGPSGQGPRTGRGMGRCIPERTTLTQSPVVDFNRRLNWGGRIWDNTIGRLFRLRRNRRF
jgi:hypothetical protein